MNNLYRKIFCALLLLCYVSGLHAQSSISSENLVAIKALEDSLMVTADSMYNAKFPEERIYYNDQFARKLVRALKIENSWSYNFQNLAKKINIILPPEEEFRMFNWDIATTEVTVRYYCAIQMPSSSLKLYGLVDYTEKFGKGLADSVLQGGHWAGCIYYRIIPKKVDGHKLFTMFGLNASSPQSNKKILDVLELTPQGPVFGAPIFGLRSENLPGQKINRFVIEYKKGVNVSMNWDNDLNAIMFDRLASQVNDPARKYTYIPTGQYDGFRWDGAQWSYVQDLIPPLILKDGEAPDAQSQQ